MPLARNPRSATASVAFDLEVEGRSRSDPDARPNNDAPMSPFFLQSLHFCSWIHQYAKAYVTCGKARPSESMRRTAVPVQGRPAPTAQHVLRTGARPLWVIDR